MIEYYLKYDKKNIKSNIVSLIKELETLLRLENISLIQTKKVFFKDLEKLISKSEFLEINNLYHTIDSNRIKNSEFVIIDKADHVVVLNNVREVSEAIFNFLKKIVLI